ncbi:GDSL family lipase [Methylobacterium platani JCM 14648]|uniref:Arylesterase n=3 Tax=Methylobacterium platani TaxID=427683 RepID=A0A179SCE4_9HYPH|nr:GDSL family lipase [Methylobacterium platani JCM 14648]OAS24059.1 arylesterase [Methylobacterium platani]
MLGRTYAGQAARRPDMGRASMVRHDGRRAALAFLIVSLLMTLVTPLHAQGSKEPGKDRPLNLVALGDSLTAGYGLPAAAAFPLQLEAALKARGHAVTVANAGVSGDTATGGLDRVDWSVPDGTDGVILELGANDMLRGTDPAVTEKALDAIVARLKARGIPVLLAGMRAAPNLGTDYGKRFDAIYPRLAERYGLILYPFFLDGVAGDRSLTLPDGLHPTKDGVATIVAGILPRVEEFLTRLRKGP